MSRFFIAGALCLATVAGFFASRSPLAAEYAADTLIFGQTQSALAADWWQWAVEAAPARHPAQGPQGEYCGAAQNSQVWFLAGVSEQVSARRTCHVPAAKALFFPLIASATWPPTDIPPDCDCSCSYEQSLAAENNDTASTLYAELDGRSIANLNQHRVRNGECFELNVPSAGAEFIHYPTAVDGFFLALKPLKRGRHILRYGGQYNNDTDQAQGHLQQALEYELIVQ